MSPPALPKLFLSFISIICSIGTWYALVQDCGYPSDGQIPRLQWRSVSQWVRHLVSLSVVFSSLLILAATISYAHFSLWQTNYLCLDSSAKQVTLTVGTPPFHLKSPRVTISLLKLNVITELIIDEDDSDWDGRGGFFPGSWGGDRHASTPTDDGSPLSPLGVFTRSTGSTDTAAGHIKLSSPSRRKKSEDHGERRKENSKSRDADKNKVRQHQAEKRRIKDRNRERDRSLSSDRAVGGDGVGDSTESVPPRQQQRIYIAVQQVHPISSALFHLYDRQCFHHYFSSNLWLVVATLSSLLSP